MLTSIHTIANRVASQQINNTSDEEAEVTSSSPRRKNSKQPREKVVIAPLPMTSRKRRVDCWTRRRSCLVGRRVVRRRDRSV